MANALSTKTTLELSMATVNDLVDSVKNGLALVSKGYLSITPDVAKLYDGKAYKTLGYKNFDEMCAIEFGMSHGTTVGIRKVFDKFGTKTKTGDYMIPEKFLDYGYTKLLLFTDKKFEDANINPIEVFTPDMTISEMKGILAEKLEDKSKKQDESAIDTDGKEVAENVSHETSSEETSEGTSPELKSDADLLTDIMTIAKELKERMNYIGGEKSCLLDAIIANAKDLKKVAKKN